MKLKIVALATLAALCATPAFAHHSGAMFDRNKEVTLTGTLKEIQWVSPHAWLEMLVPTGDGKFQQWSLEFGGGPATFPGLGITRSYPKVGDKITVVAHPLRDGRPGGSFMRITLPDGRVMGGPRPAQGAPAAPAAR
jgi:hypothetical protein